MENRILKTPVHHGRYNMDFTGEDPYGNAAKARAHMRSLEKSNYTYLLECAREFDS